MGIKKDNYKKLTIEKGSTKNYELQFTSDGASQSIEDWTVYFTLKEDMEDADSSALIKKTITSHSDASGGITLVELSKTDTNLTPGTYYFSFDYKDDDDNEGVLFWGHLTIKDSVLDSRS